MELKELCLLCDRGCIEDYNKSCVRCKLLDILSKVPFVSIAGLKSYKSRELAKLIMILAYSNLHHFSLEDIQFASEKETF